jgi:nitrous oxide reductase accessory protein NosL
MKPTFLVLAAALAVTGACRASADGPPAIALDRTTCSECGMLVSEAVFAAASRTASGDTRVFDDVRCLRKAHAATDTKSIEFWFHDARDESWISGRHAVFVEAASLQTPMGGGFLVFRDRAVADAEATVRHGRVAGSTDDLLKNTGGRQ